MEPDNKASGSLLERAAAFAPSGPTMNQLISLIGAVRVLERAHGWPEHAATKFLVSELQEAAYGLPLYWLLSGGEVLRLPDERVPMEPEAMPTAWTSTRNYYLSERDRLLSSLWVALAGNHMIGDAAHEASRRAGFLHLLRADFDRYFIAPLPVPELKPEATELPPEPAPAPEPAAPSKPPAAPSLKWTDEQLQTLVNAKENERRKHGDRGAIARILKDWDKHFPSRPKVSHTALKKAFAQATKRRITPQVEGLAWLPIRKAAGVALPGAHLPSRVHKLDDD
jgi:hypothetical protein